MGNTQKLKLVKPALRAIGFTLNKNTYGEYVLRSVEKHGKDYAVEYFAGDLDEAISTAEAITGKKVEY